MGAIHLSREAFQLARADVSGEQNKNLCLVGEGEV